MCNIKTILVIPNGLGVQHVHFPLLPSVRTSLVQSDTKWLLISAMCHMGKKLALKLSFTNFTCLNRCPYLYVIKFLNVQNTAPIVIHRQLFQVYVHYVHIRLNGHSHLLQEFSWEVFNHHPSYSPDLTPSDFHLFLYLRSASAFSEWQSFRRWVSQWSKSQATDFYDTGYKSWFHGMTNVSIPEVKNMLKIAQHLLYLFH